MKIVRFFVWIFAIGVVLYLIGALTIQDDKVIITTSVVVEKSGEAVEGLDDYVRENEAQNETTIFDKFKFRITSNVDG